MAENSLSASDDGVDGPHVTVHVPAEHVEDFRKAIVEEIRWEAQCIVDCGKDSVGDIRGDAALMAHDVALFDQLEVAKLSDSGDAALLVEGLMAVESVPHVFEAMARKVLGPRLAEQLGYGPMDEELAAGELRGLVARLAWAVDRAAEFHDKAFELRQSARSQSKGEES